MADYRIRWAKVTGPWKDGRRRMCIAEKKVRLLYLLPVWWPVEHGGWRLSEADCQKDIDFDGKFCRPLPATATVSMEASEAQQQAQAALDKAMNGRCDAFDRGAVCHWAERGLYQVKADPAPKAPLRVKPLEWLEGSWGRELAYGIDGRYAYEVRGEFDGHSAYWMHQGVGLKKVDVASLEMAKAAAQSDYERRILSALATEGQDNG